MIEIGVSLAVFLVGYVCGKRAGCRQGALVRTTEEYLKRRDALIKNIEDRRAL